MKAILVSSKDIRVVSVKTPTLKTPRDVLIKVKAVGLCGSDIQRIKAIQKNSTTTAILGHEVAGEIVKIGEEVKNFKKGDRVVIEPLINCAKCRFCRSGNYQLCSNLKSVGKNLDGGFAEYIVVPNDKILKLERGISYEVGVLLDSLAVCVHAFNMAEGVEICKIAVIGDGSIGRICTLLADYYKKAKDIYIFGKHIEKKDFSSRRIKIINPLIASNFDGFRNYFDVVFECVGREQSNSLDLAVDLVKPKGKIVVLGVFPENYLAMLNVRKLFVKEATLVGSNSYGYYKGKKEINEALKILNKNALDLKGLVTHILPLSQFEKGIWYFENKEISKAIKIVFIP
ncbi:MAG TPA: alcohol dehydrogenase catalytic domain-containing protein [Candidatus Paceibacterota bacterium]|nr:alcohol dehydrogenase catalytic domain-containing protein [Candidatus Paceibacterota bacterium]